MKRVSILLALVLISFNSFSQQFTKVTSGPIVENIGKSVHGAWGDYDNDGDLELYATGAGGAGNPSGNPYLYQNNCNGGFTRVLALPDGIIEGREINTGIWIDYDNDGLLDMFGVTGSTTLSNVLYKNEGEGTFSEVTSGDIVTDISQSVNSSWVDYDNDGDLDCYVANFRNRVNFLYENNGNGTFTKITTGTIVTDLGFSQAAVWGDYDDDGFMDLYTPNGLHGSLFSYLYHNNGDGTFTGVTGMDPIFGRKSVTAAAWGDYDNDGDLDLFEAEYGGNNKLYKNDGNGNLVKVTTGIAVNDAGFSRDIAWIDYDNDGDLDLWVVNHGQNFLYSNDGSGNFTKITNEILVTEPDGENSLPYGSSWADFDNDGDLDLFVPDFQESMNNLFYINNGNSNTWLKVSLKGTGSNSMGIGARIKVKATINGNVVWQMREIAANGNNAGSTAAISGIIAHFGLGNAGNIDELKVYWPKTGVTQTFTNVSADQHIIITEGSGSIVNRQACISDFPINNPAVIEGFAYNDNVSDCNFDAKDDYPAPNVLMEATPGPYFAYTDNEGNYSFNLPGGTYTVAKATVQDPAFSLNCPSPTSNFTTTISPGTITTAPDFGFDRSHGVDCPDVTFTIQGGVLCPGTTTRLCVTFTNNGHHPVKNPIFTIRATTGNFSNCSPIPSSTVSINSCGAKITASSASLNFNATVEICFDYFYPGGTVTLTARIDGTPPSHAIDCPDPYADSATNSLTEGCPFDPNDKKVIPGGCGVYGNIGQGEELKYRVRFQNIGTGPALNVLIRDQIDSHLDLGSFRIIGSSHNISRFSVIPDNVMVIEFNGINLPYKDQDPEGSKGFVEFVIKPLNPLPNATSITNQAAIYFDQNEAVITNSVINTVRDVPIPQPAISASGPIDFCEGGKVLLDAGPGYFSYEWSNGETTQTINVTQSDSYDVTVTNDGSCEGLATPVIVTVFPGPNPPVNSPADTCLQFSNGNLFNRCICQGEQQYMFTDNYVQYQWNLNGFPISGATARDYYATQAGTYTVTVVDINGCVGTTSLGIILIVYPAPQPKITADGPTTFCLGDSVKLFIPDNIWNLGGQFFWNTMSAEQYIPAPYIIVPNSGDYWVTETGAQCSGKSNVITVSVNTCKWLGSNQGLNTGFKMDAHPNPFKNNVAIHFMLDEDTKAKLEVFDISGKRVGSLFSGNLIKDTQYEFMFDASKLSRGVYIYKLSTPLRNLHNKLILID